MWFLTVKNVSSVTGVEKYKRVSLSIFTLFILSRNKLQLYVYQSVQHHCHHKRLCMWEQLASCHRWAHPVLADMTMKINEPWQPLQVLHFKTDFIVQNTTV